MRRLIGRRGVKFKRFYVTDPLPGASRARSLTGQYAHNIGHEQDLLGAWLQQAGYRTAYVGEYLNGYGIDDREHVPQGWSEWHALLEPTTQSYFDYDLNSNGEVVHYGSEPEDYKSRVLGHLAVDAVRHAARGSRPLFLYLELQRPARAEHAGAGRRGLASPGRPRRARPPSTRPTSPTSRASCATARRWTPSRSRGSTRATRARWSRSPRSTARSPSSSRRCAPRASWATPS